MLNVTAQELHAAADDAAYAGDYQTADALRLLENNARAGEAIKAWAYHNLLATDEEIWYQVHVMSVCWNASEAHLHREATKVYLDAAKAA